MFPVWSFICHTDREKRHNSLSLHLKDNLPSCFCQSVSPAKALSVLYSLLPFKHMGTLHTLSSHQLLGHRVHPHLSMLFRQCSSVIFVCVHMYMHRTENCHSQGQERTGRQREKKVTGDKKGNRHITGRGGDCGKSSEPREKIFLERWGIVSSYSARHHAH